MVNIQGVVNCNACTCRCQTYVYQYIDPALYIMPSPRERYVNHSLINIYMYKSRFTELSDYTLYITDPCYM